MPRLQYDWTAGRDGAPLQRGRGERRECPHPVTPSVWVLGRARALQVRLLVFSGWRWEPHLGGLQVSVLGGLPEAHPL